MGMRHWRRYVLAAVVVAVLGLFLLWPIAQVVVDAFDTSSVPADSSGVSFAPPTATTRPTATRPVATLPAATRPVTTAVPPPADGDGLSVDRGDPLAWFKLILADESYLELLFNAARVAVCATLASLALALPLAVLADRVNFRGKALASAMLMVPMILPPFVGALAFKKLFSRGYGPVNLLLKSCGVAEIDFLSGGFWAVVILEALHLYPIVFLNATAALANIDPAMSEAARNLGASRWRVFRRITLPLMRPGLFAGTTIVFIWSFCELGTPLMVGYSQVLPVRIFNNLKELDDSGMTFALVLVMLSASVGMYMMGKVFFGRGASASAGRAVVAGTQRRAGLIVTALCWLAFGVVTLVAVVPHIGVVLMSVTDQWNDTILPSSYTIRHLQAVFEDPDTWNAIINSLRYAGAATVLCAVLGFCISHLVVRCRIWGGGVLDTVGMLPLAVPGLVMATGYVAITRSGGPLEAIGPMRNPAALLIIAYTIRRLPYMIRSLSAGLQQTPVALEEAAENLGASRLRAMMKVTIPLILANILAGSILTFSFNMLEVSDSLILAQTREFYPITKQIYELRQPGPGQYLASALGVYGMVLLGGTLLLANVLLGKRMGQLFRV